MARLAPLLLASALAACSAATEPRGSVEETDAGTDAPQETRPEAPGSPDAVGIDLGTVPGDSGAPESTPEAETPTPAPSSVRCKVTGGKVYECGAGVFPESGAHVSWNWEGKGQACGPTNYAAGTVPCAPGSPCSVFIPSSTTLLGSCL